MMYIYFSAGNNASFYSNFIKNNFRRNTINRGGFDVAHIHIVYFDESLSLILELKAATMLHLLTRSFSAF